MRTLPWWYPCLEMLWAERVPHGTQVNESSYEGCWGRDACCGACDCDSDWIADGVEGGGRGMLCAKRPVEGSEIDGCHAAAGRFKRAALEVVLDTLRAGRESAEKMADAPLEAILLCVD